MTEVKQGTNGMGWNRLQAVLAVGLVLQLSIGSAASPAIGVVTAKGSFDLDSSKVPGNGTLFEGSTVETGKASSELRMKSGVRLVLDTGTRGKVYGDYLLLEKGAGQIDNGGSYRIRARSLQIATDGAAKVSLVGRNRVVVAALTSPVRVTNASGLLIANLATGQALELEPQEQAGAAAPSTLTGCLQKKNGRMTMTDVTSGVMVELQGAGLENEAGNTVQITGVRDTQAVPVAGASQVIRTSQVKRVATRCSTKAAKAAAGAGAGAAGAAGAGTAAGISATTAVVAGVVMAGVVAGVAVGVTRADSSGDRPDISQ